jgi:hypothetical protein
MRSCRCRAEEEGWGSGGGRKKTDCATGGLSSAHSRTRGPQSPAPRARESPRPPHYGRRDPVRRVGGRRRGAARGALPPSNGAARLPPARVRAGAARGGAAGVCAGEKGGGPAGRRRTARCARRPGARGPACGPPRTCGRAFFRPRPGDGGRRPGSGGDAPRDGAGERRPAPTPSLSLLQGPMRLMQDAYATKGECFTVPVLHK